MPETTGGSESGPRGEIQVADFFKAILGHPREHLNQVTLFTGLREGETPGFIRDCPWLDCGMLLVKQHPFVLALLVTLGVANFIV